MRARKTAKAKPRSQNPNKGATNLTARDAKGASREHHWIYDILECVTEGTQDLIAALDTDFRYIFLNRAYHEEFQRVFGSSIEIGSSIIEALAHLPEKQQKAKALWGRALEGESFVTTEELGDLARDRRVYEIRYHPIRDREGRLTGATHVMRDVTERNRAEKERELTIQFLHLVGRSQPLRQLLRDATDFLQRISGCEAVGVRLRVGDDFPFVEARGFPLEVLDPKQRLFDPDPRPDNCKENESGRSLSCLCRAVAEGRHDRQETFFTEGGSFWSTSLQDLVGRTPSLAGLHCLQQNPTIARFQSMALVPLHVSGERVGVLHFAHGEAGFFDPRVLPFWEHLGNALAVAIAKGRTEEALRRTEARWNAAIENLDQGVVIANEQEELIYWNPAAQLLHGLSGPLDGIGPLAEMSDIFQLLTPDGSRILNLEEWPMKRIKRGERVAGLELRLRRLDQGWEKVVSYSGALVQTAGAERLIFLSLHELTEQRKVERHLQETNERYELILAGTHAGIWDWDITGEKVMYSARWKAMRGFEEDEISDSPEEWSSRIHPDDLTRVMTALKAHFEGSTPWFSEEYRVRRKDGSWMWIADHGISRRNPQGQVARMAGSETDITERKLAEEALYQKQQDLKRAQEVGQMGSWRLDIRKDLLLWSDETYRVFGLPVGTPVSYESFLALVHPEDRRYVDSQWQAALAGNPYDIEHRLLIGGQEKWVRQKAFLDFDAAGNLLGAFGIAQDISQRKRAELTVSAHRELLQAVFDHLPIAVNLIRGSDLRIQFCNPAYQSFAPGKRMLGKTLDELWPEAGGTLNELCRKVLASGEPYREVDSPYQIRRSEYGPLEMAYFSWALFRVRLPGDEGWAVLNTAWETTDRKTAEEKLRESERRLALAVEGSQMGIWEWNLVTGESVWSDREFELLGFTPGAAHASGSVFFRHVHPEDISAVQASIKQAVDSGAGWRHEFRIVLPTGEVRWLVGAGGVQLGPNGEPERMIGVNFDVTERKEAEKVLQRSKEELEKLVTERTSKLQELVGELEHFSYTITHDMRAPLRAMQGFAEMMAEAAILGQEPEIHKLLERIKVSASRMDALITDALNYNRTVRQELPLEPVDVEALVRGILDTYPEFQVSRADIQVVGEIPLVMGNQAGLTQCFSNLLGNAVKFVRPGQKPAVRIRAELRDPSNLRNQGLSHCVRIWVEDNGIGIPAALLTRVFDMFSRGHRTYEGTGIGLALVRKVMERMGGKAGVESEEEKGSRFWLDFEPVL